MKHLTRPRVTVLRLETMDDRITPAAGGLDPSFGAGGIVTTAVSTGRDQVNDMAFDAIGRIVVAGNSFNGSNFDFALARYNIDGTLDSTFDGDGKATTPIGSGDDFGQSVAIDAVGRIVVAGISNYGSGGDFALARYNSDGSLDNTFSGDGKVTTSFGPGEDFAWSVAIDGSGRIVLAGHSYNGSNRDIALARYNSDGSLDTSFSGDGMVTTDISGINDYCYCVAIDNNDSIVIAGSTAAADEDLMVARYNVDGTLDSSFGGDGIAIAPTSSGLDVAINCVIDASDRIVIAGHSWNGSNRDFLVARFNGDGTLDASFNHNGYVTTTIGPSDDLAGSLAIDGSGRIVVVGGGSNGSNFDSTIVRYNDAGALDSAFDFDGKVTIAIGTGDDGFLAVLIDSTGRIVVAGDGIVNNSIDFTLARFFSDHFNAVPGSTSLTYSENDALLAISNSIALTNSPNANLVGATVKIGNYLRNQDVLGYALQGGITGSFDSISGVLTLNGTASIADYEAVLRSLTYTNTSDQPLELSRTITVTVDDGETHDNLATATYTIHIVGVNDAPVLTDGAVLPSGIQAGTSLPGRKISSLFAGLVTDPDASDSLTGLAVVGNPSDGEQGRWQYSTDDATWVDVGAVADGATALALSATTKLRFLPAPWFVGEPAPLFVRALDSSYAGAFTGVSPVTIDTSIHGGTTAISDSTAEVQATIWPNPIGGAWLSPAGNLIVEGTAGNDIIAINRAKDVTKVVVKLNKTVLGEFAGVSGKIDVRAGVGADRVTISSKITKPSLIDGGPGNDTLTGGAGDDTILGGAGDDRLTGRAGRNVLIGGEGNDVLTGGGGRDVLLGGAGADKLVGGKGEDLLLGGVTDFETDPTGLNLIVAEWNSGSDYADRVAHLTGTPGGLNGTAFLSAATVHDDGVKDVLTGGKDLDWFVVSALDTLDLKSPELKLVV
jgi:uncharacterized delta-60 repeat protein